MGNIHQNAINHDRLVRNGSSFNAKAEKDFLTTSDGWFRPISEQVGPDGALWVGDWYDKYPCYQNAQADPEGVDRERGRIWRIVYTGKSSGTKVPSRPDTKMDLAKLGTEQLVKMLEHPNIWQRRMAQRLLNERCDQRPAMSDSYGFTLGLGIGMRASAQLKRIVLEGTSVETRLAALWTLHGVEGISEMDPSGGRMKSWPDMLEEFMGKGSPEVRSWAVRFAAEKMRPLDQAIAMSEKSQNSDMAKNARGLRDRYLSAFEKLAADSDPAVRLAVAAAVRQIVSSSLTVDTELNTGAPVGPILAALSKAADSAKDPLLPFMIWMAGEAVLAEHPEGGLSWLAGSGADTLPLSATLARKAMRRICDTQSAAKMDAAVDFLARIAAGQNSELVLAALDGLIEGQRAKPLLPNLDAKPLFAALDASSNAQIKERGQLLGTLWGNASAIQATLGAINDSSKSIAQ